MYFIRLVLFASCFVVVEAQAQETSLLDSLLPDPDKGKKLQLITYGSVNYHAFDWQILPSKRDEVDFERAVIEGSYHFAPKYALNAELEFENGGTGVAVEFDPFEEFGEFEYEVEKGGEVRFEEFNLSRKLGKNHELRAGYVKIPFGLVTFRDEPDEYLTNTLPLMENSLLPTDWAEFGLLLSGNFSRWKYHLGLVNGLDGSAFNSANFIKRGNQKRFETVNASDWAVVGRLDYEFGHEQAVGFAGYFGNTRNNRPKPDLQVDAYLAMFDAHIVYEVEPFELTAQLIYGHLQNSEAVTNANRNLSNNLNVKRTPVGSSALGWSAELGFELFDVLPRHPDGELIIFGRYDWFDPMHTTEGQIVANPRWQRAIVTAGLNYQPIPQLVLKSQYSVEELGISTTRFQRTFSLGLGFHIR
ncbi:MAG: autotransporter outer membrane beta-barrel domain-containing protein [Saprospiraceae bacterium]